MDFSMEKEAAVMAECQQHTFPKARLNRLKEIQHRFGLARSTIYRWMVEGQFLKPVTLGGHAVA